MEIAWQGLSPIKSYTAKMLGVDCYRDIVWDNRTAATRDHDRNQHITWINRVPLELLILFFGDEPVLPPPKMVSDSIVDTKYSDTLIDKFAMQELASERASTNRALAMPCNSLNGRLNPPLPSLTEDGLKMTLKDRPGVLEVLFGVGFGSGEVRKRFVEQGDDSLLFGERGNEISCDLTSPSVTAG